MKRFLLAFLTLTIALAPVCWADEITGTWIYDHQGAIAPDIDPKELEELDKTLNEFMQKQNIEVYITARSDGTMVFSYVYDNEIDARIGDWYKYAPDRYVFMYSFSTLTGEGKQHIYCMGINDELLEFEINQAADTKIIYYFNKIEEE